MLDACYIVRGEAAASISLAKFNSMKITSTLILRFMLVLGSTMWAACDTKAPTASGDTEPVSNDLYSGVEFDMPRVSEPGFPRIFRQHY